MTVTLRTILALLVGVAAFVLILMGRVDLILGTMILGLAVAILL